MAKIYAEPTSVLEKMSQDEFEKWIIDRENDGTPEHAIYMNEKTEIIENIVRLLLNGQKDKAKALIRNEYPHNIYNVKKRSYTIAQKMEQFCRDGFIDRYTGHKLLNPGILKVITYYFPTEFPYQTHWKMTETHMAYWELTPTVDHIYPIARGGYDNPDNWATTSMKNNSIKSNWSLDEIHWQLHPPGSMEDWDGLTSVFLKIVDQNIELLNDEYIKTWYKASIANQNLYRGATDKSK